MTHGMPSMQRLKILKIQVTIIKEDCSLLNNYLGFFVFIDNLYRHSSTKKMSDLIDKLLSDQYRELCYEKKKVKKLLTLKEIEEYYEKRRKYDNLRYATDEAYRERKKERSRRAKK
jgi:hypothetical protein